MENSELNIEGIIFFVAVIIFVGTYISATIRTRSPFVLFEDEKLTIKEKLLMGISFGGLAIFLILRTIIKVLLF